MAVSRQCSKPANNASQINVRTLFGGKRDGRGMLVSSKKSMGRAEFIVDGNGVDNGRSLLPKLAG